MPGQLTANWPNRKVVSRKNENNSLAILPISPLFSASFPLFLRGKDNSCGEIDERIYIDTKHERKKLISRLTVSPQEREKESLVSTRAQTEAHYRYVTSCLKSDRTSPTSPRAPRPFYSISLSPWAPLILLVAAPPLRNRPSFYLSFLSFSLQHYLTK